MKEVERRQLLNIAQKFVNQETDHDPDAVGAAIRTFNPRTLAFGVSGKLADGTPAIHAAVDAICTAARSGVSLKDAFIVLTRRPCPACAQAIVQAGVHQVFYAGEEEVDELTKKLLAEGCVKLTRVEGWTYVEPKK